LLAGSELSVAVTDVAASTSAAEAASFEGPLTGMGTKASSLSKSSLRTTGMFPRAESITCGWLSLVVVIGLIADLLLGAWWVDAVTSLAIVWFVVKEGREAWKGEDCCEHD
jgi:hypothetical protein